MTGEAAHRVRGISVVPAAIGPAVTAACTISWALATLFDEGWYGHWAWSPTNFVLAAACGWLLAAPRSARALLVLAAAQIADWFSDQSIMGNHPIIMALVNATLLVAALRRGAARTWRDNDAMALMTTVAPGVRLGVFAVYFWATFHKLNTDFLSLDHGCVTFIATEPRHRPWPALVLGDNIFYGHGLVQRLHTADQRTAGATVFA